MCREGKAHWGSSGASTPVLARPDIGGENIAEPLPVRFRGAGPAHGIGQRITTVPSRIGPVEVDFVLVRHFSGRIFVRPSSVHQTLRSVGFGGTLVFSGA